MDNKKILIIDDEPALLNALVDKFTREGFEVLTAENGQDGFKCATKNHPDIILLDIVMPIMDGLEMLGKLRKDVWGKKVKVILLTNLSNPVKNSEYFDKKSSNYMLKSDWKIENIVKQVNKKIAE